MARWLLCDYGEVLCVPPPVGAWAALLEAAAEAGYDRERDFPGDYWAHRQAYDRADLTARDYWTKTIGTRPGPDRLRDLIGADQNIWTFPNHASVEAATRAQSRGWKLALFSNAPVEVAAAIDAQPWLEPFQPRFFSCHLRAVKPEPRAYQAVLRALRAEPGEIVFFDDRPPNVEEAVRIGIDARLFQNPVQFDWLQ
jgi:putative hydrolase of the HAD superfamily